MNEQQTAQPPAAEQTFYEPCLCRELLDQFRAHFHITPEVKQHLTNSRVEFLKAIRQVIDARIEHLSTKASHGTKIAVE
jgi:hypothetical protein